jgi:predicted AAA+ superfamily ATPase
MNALFEKIAREQAEERSEYRSASFITRDAEQYFSKQSKLIKIIMGIRRSGKSTLGHRISTNKDYAYLNFDDERLIGIKPAQLDELLEALYAVHGDFTHLLLDEIQNVDKWSLFVNRLQRQKIQIIITGSNSKMLSKELATHVTGRYESIELLPFSFKEFLAYKKFKYEKNTTKSNGLLIKYLDQYMQYGGMPEIVQGIADKHYVRNLVNAIISRDVLDRYRVKHVVILRQIAYYLMANFAHEMSFNRIKNQFDLGSEHTAKNYVNYLEEAYLIFTLPKFSYKKIEQLKYRKIYVPDTAFVTSFSDAFTHNYGFLLENLVFLELYRRKVETDTELFYYKQDEEVDFVVTRNMQIQGLIQVSFDMSNEKTLNREIKALVNASNRLKLKKVNLTIITHTDERTIEIEGKTINVVPVGKWLLKQ